MPGQQQEEEEIEEMPPQQLEQPTAPEEVSDEELSDIKTSSIGDNVLCSICGYSNDSATNYCGQCGNLLGNTAPSTASWSASSSASSADTIKETMLWTPLWSQTRLVRWATMGAILLNIVLFLVWLFTTNGGLPWFIYPLAASIISCGCLYLASHEVEKPLLQLHVLVSAVVNFTLIFTYVFQFTRQPYFAYVLLASAGLLSFHLLITDHWGSIPRPHKFFYIHLISLFSPLNLILFTVFLTTRPDFAWFVFPLLISSVPMMAHFVIAFHPTDPHKWFYVNLTSTSVIAGLLFLVWAVTPVVYPWFVYFWLMFGAWIGGHYVVDYHREVLQRGASLVLGFLQNCWSKIRQLSTISFFKRKRSNTDEKKAPAGTTDTSETSGASVAGETSQTTGASYV
jgi:hypothetical protein